MVGTLALILTFSPRRRNSIWQSSGFADDRPANSAARISVRRETILLLLGEKAGMREVVTNHLGPDESDGEHAAVQTLREVRSARQSRSVLDCACL